MRPPMDLSMVPIGDVLQAQPRPAAPKERLFNFVLSPVSPTAQTRLDLKRAVYSLENRVGRPRATEMRGFRRALRVLVGVLFSDESFEARGETERG